MVRLFSRLSFIAGLYSSAVFAGDPSSCEKILEPALGNMRISGISAEAAGVVSAYGTASGGVQFGVGEVALFLYAKGIDFQFGAQGAHGGLEWFDSSVLGQVRTQRSRAGTPLQRSDILDIRLPALVNAFWFHLLESFSRELDAAFTIQHGMWRSPRFGSLTVEKSWENILEHFPTAKMREGVLLASLISTNQPAAEIYLNVLTEKQAVLVAFGISHDVANLIATRMLTNGFNIQTSLGRLDPNQTPAWALFMGDPSSQKRVEEINRLMQRSSFGGQFPPRPLPN